MDETAVTPVEQTSYSNEDYEKSSPIKSSLWIFISILVVGLVGFGLYFLYGYVEDMNQELDQIATDLQEPATTDSTSTPSDEMTDSTSGFGYAPGVTPTPSSSASTNTNGFSSGSGSSADNYGYAPGTNPTPSSSTSGSSSSNSSSTSSSDTEFSMDVAVGARQNGYFLFDYDFIMNSAAQAVLDDGFSFKVEHNCEQWLEESDDYFDGAYDSDDTIGTGLGFLVKLPEAALNDDDLYEDSTYVIKNPSGKVVFTGEVEVPDCR